jgi:dipeptidyl aminopeptidase/acylaminoacyl peptidase
VEQTVSFWARGLAAAMLGFALALAGAASAAAPPPPSAHDFARAAAIWDVSISPDGRHIVALTSPDGAAAIISVWRADAPGAKPVNLGSTHMRFLGVRFLKNDRLLVSAIQPLTAGVMRGHVIKQYVTDLEGNAWAPLLPEARALQSEDEAFVDRLQDAELISPLPRDPQDVLVEDLRLEGRGDVYKVNVYTGVAERLEQGSERFFGYRADLNGEVRAKQELNYDGGKVYIAQWFKSPDSGKWEELFRLYAKDRQGAELAAFTTDPNIVYVADTGGGDKLGIYEYDVRQRKRLEPVFAHKLFDTAETLQPPVVVQSRDKADYGRVLGFGLLAETGEIYWTDDKIDSIVQGLKQALGVTSTSQEWTDPGTGLKARIAVPNGADVRLTSWSDDMSRAIVEKSGPNQPAEYYLLAGGARLALLGKARPWIATAALGESRMVEYPARDGQMIPAFLTTPPKDAYGPGPYPTLIEPHGGPWARDGFDWDITGWTQYFAAHGYAVLRPQFRGSEGWGQKLWRAGDGEWGQAMQDDKDDGVKWLIAQKIADPRRVAMFGYSYGGYAALVAAIRPNGLYQCAISGAGAGDLASIERATFDNRFQREFQHPTVKGLDALEHAREAQIPVFLYHGDRDQTVDIAQSRKFAAALRAAGKPYKLLEIPDMGHQYVTWTPPMTERQLVEVEAFLEDGCKPGGL